jgi:hypothetical protein
MDNELTFTDLGLALTSRGASPTRFITADKTLSKSSDGEIFASKITETATSGGN